MPTATVSLSTSPPTTRTMNYTSPPRPVTDLTRPRSLSASPVPHSSNKIKHRSSKPILAWVQRKFAAAGAVKKDHHHHKVDSNTPSDSIPSPSSSRIVKPYSPAQLEADFQLQQRSKPGPHSLKSKTRGHSTERHFSKTQLPLRKKIAQGGHHIPTALAIPGNSSARVGGASNLQAYNSDSPPSSPRSGSMSLSLAPGSTWSPDNPPEADDDASIRPLPPTSPPSPAPSRTTHYTMSSQTSGYLSDPRTFRSGAASTKPTTLLSIDLIPAGGHMAHIAQVAPSITSGRSPSMDGGALPGASPSSPSFSRFPNHQRQQSAPTNLATTPTSLMFSLPSGSRHPLSSTQHAEDLASDVEDNPDEPPRDQGNNTQAPALSHPHPRNNPRPSSPPMDNASTLTLASSTFANHRPGAAYASSIISRFPGSLSLYGGGSIHRILNGNESIITAPGLDAIGSGGGGGQDPDASVRALRPRSRAGSWASVGSAETNQTGWSAAVLNRLGPAARKKRGDTEGDEDEMNLYAAGDEDEGAGNDSGANEGSSRPTHDSNSQIRGDFLAAPKLEVITATPEDSKVGTPVKGLEELPKGMEESRGEDVPAPIASVLDKEGVDKGEKDPVVSNK